MLTSLVAPILGSPKRSTGKTIKAVLAELGFDDEINSLWEAGSRDSWSGSGDWNDVGPAAAHMQRGPVAVPLFSGAVGGNSLNEYWAGTGSAKFTLASGVSNPAWVNAFHQDNANQTLFAVVQFGTATTNSLIGNYGTGTANIGFGWFVTSAFLSTLVVTTGTAQALSQNWAIPSGATGVWYLLAVSINEATGANGIVWSANSSTDNSDPSGYTSPSGSPASLGLELMTRGNAGSPLAANGRLHCIGALNRALSAAELVSLNTGIQAARGY